jgi:hypothetical protein
MTNHEPWREELFQLILLGPPDSGKTVLAQRLVYALPKPEVVETTSECPDAARPFAPTSGKLMFPDMTFSFAGRPFRTVRFTEIGGRTKTDRVPHLLYRQSPDVFLLCFDSTRLESFKSLCADWLPSVIHLICEQQEQALVHRKPFLAVIEFTPSNSVEPSHTKEPVETLEQRKRFRYVLDRLLEPNLYQYFALTPSSSIDLCKLTVSTMLDQVVEQRRPRALQTED